MEAAPESQLPQVHLAPGMIHLGIGQPTSSLLPLRELNAAAAHCLGRDQVFFLSYGDEPGNLNFRETWADFLTQHYQQPVGPGDLMITSGASQALDLVCTLFARPGDTVLVEAPSYFLALKIFKDHHLNLVSIPVDEEGLVTQVLEETLETLSPAFLYTIPFFQNPASVTLSPARGRELLAICGRRNLMVVADEVYYFLNYTETPPLPLATFGNQCPVLSLGSFSKILAPGLRLGWLQASPDLVTRISRSGLLQSGGGLNPFASEIVNTVVQQGALSRHITHLKQVYTRRAEVLCRALRQNFPETVSFQLPRGGYFVWLEFPPGTDTLALRETAQQLKVDFYPGSFFSSSRGFESHMRLCFAFYEEAQLIEGVKRLARAVEQLWPDLWR